VAGLLAVSILIFSPCTSFLEAQACKAASAAQQLPEHASGCHQHASPAQHPMDLPSAPARGQCCVNGYHAAIPSGVSSPRPAVDRVFFANDGASAALSFLAPESSPSVVSANSPPGFSPLRI
jgi:hypothetical protein